MPRAFETAQIANQVLGKEIQVDVDFEEFRPGDADGMTYSDYVERYGRPDQLAEPHRPIAPNGESRTMFFLRVGVAFDRLLERSAGRSVAVFCHGGVVDAVVRQLLTIHGENPFQLHTLNTSMTEFVSVDHGPPRRWRLARYNDSAHLAGLPASTN
jgi:probable phosphoglycerate mutase